MILALLLGIPFVWWVAILITIFIIDVMFFAYECYGWSITIMTATILGALWIDHHAATPVITANLHKLLLYYVPIYLAAGFGTALIKWILYAAKRVGWIKQAKEQFDLTKTFTSSVSREDVHVESMNAAQKRETFVRFYKKGLADGAFADGERISHKVYEVDYEKETSVVDALTPRAKDNIGTITIWIYQWPVVIVSSLIEEFLIKFVKHFATALDALFSKVVRKMVAKATQGL